ncbi:MAG: hypothetical protein IPN76_21900, partial [Saprospiraceae bacterium]|nr:hypothetical protein [Saprospiraceae bacterium]
MEEQQFDEQRQELMSTFGLIASSAIASANILRENLENKKKNIVMTKPYIESLIISGMGHNTGNLVDAAIRNFSE